MHFLEEARREARRAYELGDMQAVIEIFRDLYRHLLEFEPEQLTDEMKRHAANDQWDLAYNAMLALDMQDEGITPDMVPDAVVGFQAYQEKAVDLSAYTNPSMN